MFSSHTETYKRSICAVKLGERWLKINRCECGQIHAYQLLSGEPDSVIPRISAEDVSQEFKDNVLRRMFLNEEEVSQELVFANS